MPNGISSRILIVLAVAAGLTSCYASPHDHNPGVEKDRFHLVCRATPIGDGEVRWIDSELDGDQKENNRWCAVVGPPVAITRPATTAPAIDSLCIVSWNAQIGGGDLFDLVSDLRSGILTNGKPVRRFVLLLQEVLRISDDVPAVIPRGGKVPRYKYYEPPDGIRRDLVEMSEWLGLNIFYVPSMRNGDPQEDRGNAILSTMPMHELTAIDLPYEVHRRVAVAASVRGTTTDGRPWTLRLCSIHLDHRSRLIRVFNSAGVGRMRQARAVVDAIPETPAVTAGDMNTWAITYVEGVVEFMRDEFGQPYEFDEKNTIASKWLPDRRIDYMFFRVSGDCRANYRRLDFRYGSDHWPIMGWVPLTCDAEADGS